MDSIDRLLQFRIRGPMAHFKKFYTNVSSLTYEVPSRTALMGMLGSILEYRRDSYYDLFHPESCKLSVQLNKPVRKYMACTNYKKKDGGTTQVRLEMLMPQYGQLDYTVYLAHQDRALIDSLYERLNDGKLGFGVYLGQRQFRGIADSPVLFDQSDVEVVTSHTGKLHTITHRQNIEELDYSNTEQGNSDIVSVRMPLSFQAAKDGREPEQTGEMVYEITGTGLLGTFHKAVKCDGQYISFYTDLN